MKYLFHIAEVMTLLSYPKHFWLITLSLIILGLVIKAYANKSQKMTYKEKLYYLIQIALSLIEKEQIT